MKKFLLLLVSVVVVAGVAGSFFLNDIIVKSINRFGPEVLGVQVSVGDVDVSPLSGKVEVLSLKVANPTGFEGNVIALDRVAVSLDPLSVFSNQVHIRNIELAAPQIDYQLGAKGSNIDALKAQLGGGKTKGTAIEEAKEPSSASSASPAKTILIDRLAINDARVTANILSTDASFTLPSIELRDLGKDGSSDTKAVVDEVLSVVVAKLSESQLGDLAGQFQQQLRAKGEEKLGEVLDNVTKELPGGLLEGAKEKLPTGAVKNLLGGALGK